jgi:hypothetical protein
MPMLALTETLTPATSYGSARRPAILAAKAATSDRSFASSISKRNSSPLRRLTVSPARTTACSR